METLEIQLAFDSKGRPRSCPGCGAPLAEAAEEPYCVACPYNRRKAKLSLWKRTLLTGFWVAVSVLIALSNEQASVQVFVLVGGFLIGFFGGRRLLIEWRTFRHVKSGALADMRLAEQPVDRAPTLTVLHNAIPRDVRFGWQARGAAFVVFVLPAMATLFLYFRHRYTALIVSLLMLITLLLVLQLLNHYSLVRNGHAVLATVIKKTMRVGGEHHVVYEFQDSTGKLRRARFVDDSGDLLEGMKFEVYVDHNRGWRQVPKVSAWFRAIEPPDPASSRAIE